MKKKLAIFILIIGVFFTLSDLHSGTVPVDKTVVNHLGRMFLSGLIKNGRGQVSAQRWFRLASEGFRDVMLSGAGYLGASLLIPPHREIGVMPRKEVSLHSLNIALDEISFGARFELPSTPKAYVHTDKLGKRFRGALASLVNKAASIENNQLRSRFYAGTVVSLASLPFAFLRLRPIEEDPYLWSAATLKAFYMTFVEMLGILEEYGDLLDSTARIIEGDPKFRDKFLTVLRSAYQVIQLARTNLGENLTEPHRNYLELLMSAMVRLNGLVAPKFLVNASKISVLRKAGSTPFIPDMYTVFPKSRVVIKRTQEQTVFISDFLRDSTPIKITVGEVESWRAQFEVVLPDGYKIDALGNRITRYRNSDREFVQLITCELMGAFRIINTDGNPGDVTVKFYEVNGPYQIKLMIVSSQRYDVVRDNVASGPRLIFDELGEFIYFEHEE